MRNLYLIQFTCEYNIEEFLRKKDDFSSFNESTQTIPPSLNERANVYAMDN